MSQTTSNNKVPGGDTPRALHWVFKIGDLDATLKFYQTIFGLKVLRHEEFEQGCDASCNGPYAGSWSKTMIGLGHTHESQRFALELTYNYGIDSYKRGNDLRYIAVKDTNGVMKQRAMDHGYTVETKTLTYVSNAENKNENSEEAVFVHSPDGYAFRILESRTTDENILPNIDHEIFAYVSLNVVNFERALDYWTNVLGMRVYYHHQQQQRAIVGFDNDQCKLELVQLPLDQAVIDRAEAFGRIAFMTRDVVSKFEAATRNGDQVLNPPIKLDTPGKATVEVTILKDRDGTEICFVGDEGFIDLSTTKPGDDKIDQSFRQNKLDVMKAYAEKMARRAANAAAKEQQQQS